MITARRQRWCGRCRRRTWHVLQVDLQVLPKYPWLESVSLVCERCGRGATWRSMGVTQWRMREPVEVTR